MDANTERAGMKIDYQYMFWNHAGGFVRSTGNKRPSLLDVIRYTNWSSPATRRNSCSSGKHAYGWCEKHRRINIWPLSIWL